MTDPSSAHRACYQVGGLMLLERKREGSPHLSREKKIEFRERIYNHNRSALFLLGRGDFSVTKSARPQGADTLSDQAAFRVAGAPGQKPSAISLMAADQASK
jgi:hypothetical protein